MEQNEQIDINLLEQTGDRTAFPMRKCYYPKCEECDFYHAQYCTVPMVINKQIYLFLEEKLRSIEEDIMWLEKTVTDEILGETRREKE